MRTSPEQVSWRWTACLVKCEHSLKWFDRTSIQSLYSWITIFILSVWPAMLVNVQCVQCGTIDWRCEVRARTQVEWGRHICLHKMWSSSTFSRPRNGSILIMTCQFVDRYLATSLTSFGVCVSERRTNERTNERWEHYVFALFSPLFLIDWICQA